MIPVYILDACALIAYLNDEEGADVVGNILQKMTEKSCVLLMHRLNLLEVYYCIYREHGKAYAEEMLADVNNSGIQIIDTITEVVFSEAGRMKATYRMSLADAILLAQSIESNACLLSGDHHELDVVERSESITFRWIR